MHGLLAIIAMISGYEANIGQALAVIVHSTWSDGDWLPADQQRGQDLLERIVWALSGQELCYSTAAQDVGTAVEGHLLLFWRHWSL